MDTSKPGRTESFNFRKVPNESIQRPQYVEARGFLDDEDYKKILESAKSRGINALPQHGKQGDKTADLAVLKASAREMVQGTGINLRDDWDIRTLMYLMLSTNETLRGKYSSKLEKKEQVFAEALRIAGDIDSFNKIREKYSSISFFDRS